MAAAALLAAVMDPDRLQGRLDQLKLEQQAQATRLNRLPAVQRLPAGHLDSLRAAVGAERGDPHRVARAVTPPGPGGPPAPPPVIYLSRSPTVSQFMSVITTCVESELEIPGGPGGAWGALERLIEDLRSRFRRFGPCDIRFIEPKLAQLLADLTGRHAFSTAPPEVTLADRATVFVVGDWATGLPQARNVAARIRERLGQVPAGIETHVIHLGDTYYSGLAEECRRRFLHLWPVTPGAATTSWTLAGNHDMYSGGHGYFDELLRDRRFAAQGACSYFALANDRWQVLGLDSAYKDPDVADLQDPQTEWLRGRVAGANGRGTVLLSHHQPYSAYEAVTTPLGETVVSALGEHGPVEAWLWGHEHRCAVYGPDGGTAAAAGRAGARYSAIVGHGGVPQLLSDPDTPHPQPGALDWALTDYYQVGEDRWGIGGFAVLEFSGPELSIQYYDEYGGPARVGPPLGRPAEIDARVTDDRPVRPPDRLTAGVRANGPASPPA